jgi:hypothetical protein
MLKMLQQMGLVTKRFFFRLAESTLDPYWDGRMERSGS